ncbi:hypothetical protein KXW65_009026 [Aspergillus fumigatus]|jgi:hypothetical protein|uniref:FAD dependent oxidoreductase n=1 Tax=Aspergillus fumigatus TaxID=746128 RepID=A0A9P8NAE1_ASPFM|nr:hypothetical protein KXX47_004595 [Aspergillus fumigatus]KAH1664675.1 hypothetical protein KXX65_001282 [Aspergillus fumigatus]KAH1736912.1 hypothetical protein KXX40_006467 [Aspergillus fumigatus]KAH1809455.1 hypothetical protein KXX19_008407 [Aspergillus fumigatus]KAH1820567.1 hypothetical protein KXX35_001729 [Aspergillus fumigatus]
MALCMFVVFFSAAAASAYSFHPSYYPNSNVIYRDVAVIGGGAAGTYAAIRLGDLGQSVVLIEKKAVLGGQTEAYKDPTTGNIIDYGVENFQNTTLVRDFFARFNIPLVPYTSDAKGMQFADFSSGVVYPNFTLPAADWSAYIAQLDKYPYLAYTWELPDPVPEDLLLPFGEFVSKYSLGNEAYLLGTYGAGNGAVLNQTTVYVLKSVDKAYIEGLQGGDVMTEHDNHAIYDKAQAALGSNALVSSTVVAASRNASGIRLVVQSASGDLKLIVAKKLLVAMPQIAANMQPLGMDSSESSVFGQFTYNALYVGLVTNTGVADFVDTLGISLNTESYNLPGLPGLVYLQSTGVAGVFRIWYSSAHEVAEADVKSATLAAIQRLTGKKAQFLVFGSHTPYQLAVSPAAIRQGFYKSLYALQGHRKTWYTGAAFLAHHTASLWNYTESIITDLVDD